MTQNFHKIESPVAQTSASQKFLYTNNMSCDSESTSWLVCFECGVASTNETIDYFSTDCSCCHHDFCADCCEIINKEKTNRCSYCVGDCNKKCHNGMDCCCSDYGDFDSDDESVESDESVETIGRLEINLNKEEALLEKGW